MRTLLTIHENELSQMVKRAYQIPVKAIKLYLETDSIEKVDKFLSSEYISEDTENIIDLCMREKIPYEEIIHPDNEERPFSYYENLGGIYDHAYGIYDECYPNVEAFINHVGHMEMKEAIKDCEIAGEDVNQDKMYRKFKRMINTQTISRNQLDEVMEMCNYFFREKKQEIVEIDMKGDNDPFVYYSIEEARKSALDWIEAQIDMYGGDIDADLEAGYIKAIHTLSNVKSVKELNEAVDGLINYKYIIWYEMLYRPVSPGCQPDGFVKRNNEFGRHGVVAYDRELTDEELMEYEMKEFIL